MRIVYDPSLVDKRAAVVRMRRLCILRVFLEFPTLRKREGDRRENCVENLHYQSRGQNFDVLTEESL